MTKLVWTRQTRSTRPFWCPTARVGDTEYSIVPRIDSTTGELKYDVYVGAPGKPVKGSKYAIGRDVTSLDRAMTPQNNAERQDAWRQRRSQRIAELEREVALLRHAYQQLNRDLTQARADVARLYEMFNDQMGILEGIVSGEYSIDQIDAFLTGFKELTAPK
jgi:hypothetical protein